MVVFCGQVLFALRMLGVVREVSKSVITASSLSGIGKSLSLYAEEFGEFPPTFDPLVARELSTPDSFSAIGDPNAPLQPSRAEPLYSSFVYHPARRRMLSDPTLIIAYERAPWSPDDLRVFRRPARWALRGDYRVELLDEPAFQAAMQTDEQRRRDLGWAIPAK